MRRSPRLVTCAGVLGVVQALVSCANVTPPGAHFSSTPPGATVLVDGRDSGHVTPCRMALDRSDHHVRFELAGFEPREVVLEADRSVTHVPWRDGATPPHGLSLPLNLEFRDLFLPVRVDRGHAPGRVYVRLQRSESN